MKRNKFALSHYKLLSCNMGSIIPIGLLEVLPGDSFQHATSCLIRCSPMLAPVMHPVHAKVHHWYVPHRLVWDDFEDFITGGPDGMDASVFPTINMPAAGGAAIGSLADYLGVPVGVPNLSVSALPFRAYNLIYNEWYRDQDLMSELAISRASGVDSTTSVQLQNACWEKDYFTSARPWEQKGPSITIPLGNTAPVVSDGTQPTFSRVGQSQNSPLTNSEAGSTVRLRTNPSLGDNVNVMFGNNTGLQTDLTGASAVTVNVLREALALQRYEEARARYGSRYTEYLRYLGVRSSDARLQRPEYLGGGKQTVQFSEVLQTAEGTNPVGEMRGHGIGAMRSRRYRRYFEEHGYIVSVLIVRPVAIYMQGLDRTFNRRTKEDFWQVELQHIGQQEILNKEVYAAHGTPDGTFGYQDRYDEYRRQSNSVAGEFRDSVLNFWHFAREFGSTPALNADFVRCVPPERPFAVPSQDVLYVMARHSVQARRMVAKVGRSYIY